MYQATLFTPSTVHYCCLFLMYDVDGKSPSTTLNDSKSKKFNLNHEIIQILHHLVITDERLFGIFQSLRLRWQQSGVDGEDPRARVTDQS